MDDELFGSVPARIIDHTSQLFSPKVITQKDQLDAEGAREIKQSVSVAQLCWAKVFERDYSKLLSHVFNHAK